MPTIERKKNKTLSEKRQLAREMYNAVLTGRVSREAAMLILGLNGLFEDPDGRPYDEMSIINSQIDSIKKFAEETDSGYDRYLENDDSELEQYDDAYLVLGRTCVSDGRHEEIAVSPAVIPGGLKGLAEILENWKMTKGRGFFLAKQTIRKISEAEAIKNLDDSMSLS